MEITNKSNQLNELDKRNESDELDKSDEELTSHTETDTLSSRLSSTIWKHFKVEDEKACCLYCT
ncbi:15139_t:CDS:1, partial [Funneliformis geosporum]